MRFFRMAEFAVLASLAFAAPAFAQEEDGVFIDPDSPSAKEYSIPFESERRQADPDQEPDAGIVQGSRSSPLFGAGIESGGEAEEAGSAARRGATGDAGKDGAEPASEPQDAGDAEVLRAATSNPGQPSGGIGVPLTIGGAGIGVLLLGGLAGLLLRRRA